MNKELEKEVCDLAKLVWDLSKKHGDIYITGYCVEKGNLGVATTGSANTGLENIEYRGNGSYTRKKDTEKLEWRNN